MNSVTATYRFKKWINQEDIALFITISLVVMIEIEIKTHFPTIPQILRRSLSATLSCATHSFTAHLFILLESYKTQLIDSVHDCNSFVIVVLVGQWEVNVAI